MNEFSGRRIATSIAAFLFTFYVCWNAWWLSLQRVPPSILLSATGIPSPTTGGTRSFLALLRGDVASSLIHNAATVPIIVLLVVTLVFVARRRIAPAWVYRTWSRLLLIAFAVKLATHTIWGR